MKTAVVFTNIGTPDSPNTKDVAKYLREFLMDPSVINLPWIFRWILVYCVIVPRRAKFSAANYRKIWQPEGSPLKIFSMKFFEKIKKILKSESVECFFAMNFGSPNMLSVVEKVVAEKFDQVLLVPLFPQFAQATTESSAAKFLDILESYRQSPIRVKIFAEFFKDDFYIANLAKKISAFDFKNYDKVVFSYHGLPVSQLKKNSFCQLNVACCAQNNRCYRSQCFKTTNLVAKVLELPESKVITCFQSRLGRGEWIQPYSTDTIKQIAKQGDKRILVVSPAFVADCLETLEEICIGLKEEFIEHGGEVFDYVSCLNDDSDYVEGFAKQIQPIVSTNW